LRPAGGEPAVGAADAGPALASGRVRSVVGAREQAVERGEEGATRTDARQAWCVGGGARRYARRLRDGRVRRLGVDVPGDGRDSAGSLPELHDPHLVALCGLKHCIARVTHYTYSRT